MKAGFLAAAMLALLPGCTGQIRTGGMRSRPVAPVTVQILAFNDFHGNLLPPKIAIAAPATGGGTVRVPAGGAAWLATALATARAGAANSVTVAAGDLVGASPLASGLFLDEPSIAVLNLIGLDYSAVGNHEFDKGGDELVRLQRGGCAKLTVRTPCRLDPHFPGAQFAFLAANTLRADGSTLFPPYAIRSFGTGATRVRIGFVGLTLSEVTTLVSPAALAGLHFTDEADTINALVPRMKREGADAIVVLIHQGGQTDVGYDDKSCAGFRGDIRAVLDRLDPAVDVIVSGHTHKAYVCEYGGRDPARPFLLTSAGQYGTLFTDITLRIDPVTHRVTGRQADNRIVQSDGFVGGAGPVAPTDLYPRYTPAPPVAAIVAQAVAAAAPLSARPVGHLAGAGLRVFSDARELVLGDLVADSYLAATAAPGGGAARIGITNASGLRADLVPAADGSVSYGQIFTVQPFGNTLIVQGYTGRQLVALLEQQYTGTHSPAEPGTLSASAGFTWAYDLSRPAGQRIMDVRLNGAPIDPAATYRVTTNNFLAAGGDGFDVFTHGIAPVGGGLDLDALEAWLAVPGRQAPNGTDRIVNRTPR